MKTNPLTYPNIIVTNGNTKLPIDPITIETTKITRSTPPKITKYIIFLTTLITIQNITKINPKYFETTTNNPIISSKTKSPSL